jgi:hypothetical protein
MGAVFKSAEPGEPWSSRRGQVRREKEVKNMGYGTIDYEPFVSKQAHLKITEIEEVDGKFEDTPLQLQCDFEVLDYEEADEDEGAWIGHTFRDWFGFSADKNGNIGISGSYKAKLPCLIKSALPTNGKQLIDSGKFESNQILDGEIRSQVVRSGKNRDGNHSRLVAESIMPKPKRPKQDADLEGVDVESLDMSQAPDFSNLKEEAS